jgi:hypothetical protein
MFEFPGDVALIPLSTRAWRDYRMIDNELTLEGARRRL